MKDSRPVNLDILTISFPLAAIASIIHRISGIIVFVGIAFILWIFDISLASEDGFNSIKEYGESPLFKFVLWAVLSALAYHMVAGIKHLILDMGIGETKQGGPIGAVVVILVSFALIASIGVWVW